MLRHLGVLFLTLLLLSTSHFSWAQRSETFLNPKEIQKIHKRANNGDAKEQMSLAVMYFYGTNVRKDYDLAKKWLEKPQHKMNPMPKPS